MKLQIENFLNEEIKTLPAVFYKLKEASQDPDSTFDELGEIIGVDPGLSIRLLKIVNSPYFGLSQKIDNIPHAMGIIGVDQLNDLILSTAITDKFKGVPKALMNMESFWKHSITCGLLAREIGRFNNSANPDQLYMAGLFHDIGALTICQRFPEPTRQIINRAKSSKKSLFEIEDEVLGFNHGDIGGALLESWGLPESLVEPVAFHNDPLSAKKYPKETGIVHIADRLTYDLELGTANEVTYPSTEEKLFADIDVSEGLFAFIHIKIVGQIDDIVRTFLGP